MTYLNRSDRITKKQLKIFNRYKSHCLLYKKGNFIINLFETRQLFYEIEELESDLLIGFNLLRKMEL